MSEARIYVEGGGSSKELHSRCREAFTKLLTSGGFAGRLPRVVACGSRNDAFDDFKIALAQGTYGFVALVVDSEEPVVDAEQPWRHLTQQPGWVRPPGAADEQVFLMTTCMETWIVADRDALREHYRGCLQANALPPLAGLEQRKPHEVRAKLEHATRTCPNAYAKDKRSFEALAVVDARALRAHLAAFERMLHILEAKL